MMLKALLRIEIDANQLYHIVSIEKSEAFVLNLDESCIVD